MTEKGKKERDNRSILDEIGEMEEWFGLDEEEVLIPFQCEDCGCVDSVPDFVVDDFSWGLKKGEEVEVLCPECNGTMKRKREAKAEDEK